MAGVIGDGQASFEYAAGWILDTVRARSGSRSRLGPALTRCSR